MIVKQKPWVILMLTNHPELRDSNEKLYYKRLKELAYDIDNKSAKELLQDMAKRKVPYLDSIARTSRIVQENNPHLRGKLWNKRKRKSIDVKHEILADK